MLETSNLKLKKPEDNDTLDPSLSLNPNMDIIDNEIGKIKEDMKNMGSDATKTNFDNSTNGMTATNVQDAIEENKTSISSLKESTGELSNLQTTNKNNLVLAINELFQSANSGKSTIATTVGSPLLASDTFSAMGTKLQTLKNTLATNIKNKGINSVGTETLQSLVNKVANIELGKKWASGEVSGYSSSYSSFKTLAGVTISCKYITISNLSFIPNTIVYIDVAMPQIGVYTNFANTYSGEKGTMVTNRFHSTSSSYTVTPIAVDENVLVSSSEIRLPFGTGTTSANTVKWIAFE